MKRISIIMLLCLSLVSTAVWSDNYFNISKNIEVFTTLYREVNTYYVDDVDASKFIRTGIDAMLASLDPYTNFYSESQVEDYRFQTTGQYGGIGAMISNKDGKIVVTDPYKGFPAEKADLRAGDVIIEIDGESTEGKKNIDLNKYLKGQAGTSIKMKVRRPGLEEILEKELIREDIKISSVPFYDMLDNEIGYIQLDGFKADAHKELQKAFQDLKGKGMNKLVLDLRGNPGGLLDQAVSICGMFIPRGSLVVETKGKAARWNASYKTQAPPLDMNIPISVLINGSSASASEIVSGVIQDYDRGVVVGTKSYGKGLVQTVRPLSYNTQVKVTTAKYHTPSGRCIQKLDYSNKVDGKAQKFDGRQAFQTKNGRTVYDADGVMPDLEVETLKYSDISRTLIKKGYIFDFSTDYRNQFAEISEPTKFELSEVEFGKFVNYISDKDYTYETKTEKSLKASEKASELDGYESATKSGYASLLKVIEEEKKNDLQKHKSEIRELLESEIVSRYYFKEGRLESTFDDDPQLRRAIEILQKPTEYASILRGE